MPLQSVFGKRTRIVVDRCNKAKLYRKGLDTLRIQELKRLIEPLTEEEYAELIGSMWVLRSRQKDLSVEDKTLLKLLFGESNSLEIAYKLQNDLTKIFDTKTSRNGGKRRINSFLVRVNDRS